MAGLDVVSAADGLDAVRTEIIEALYDWVMGSRIKAKAMRRSPVLTWAESLAAWVDDGIVMLGGIPESAKFGWIKQDPAQSGGLLALLMQALPLLDIDPLAIALRRASVVEEPGSYKAMERLLHSLLGSLAALGPLADGLKQYSSNLPARDGKNRELRTLMLRLSYCFQQLHGRRYTVITPNPASHSPASPTGPALEWTRVLFHLFADQARAIPDEPSVDKLPELLTLAEWIDQPHTAAELIKPIDHWDRKAAARASHN